MKETTVRWIKSEQTSITENKNIVIKTVSSLKLQNKIQTKNQTQFETLKTVF